MHIQDLIAKTIVLSGCITLLAGCGGRSAQDQATIDSLTQKVDRLEQENQQLKARANSQEAMGVFFKTLAQSAAPPKPLQISPLNQASVNASAAAAETNADASETNARKPLHVAFNDLNDTAQRPMIEELCALGIFDGMPSGKFEPDKQITRGEYVTWLYNAYNREMPLDKQIHMAPSAPPYFKDLNPNHPAYKYAQAMANAGYSVGYDDKTFRADQPITREEMIGMKVGVDCGKSFEPYRNQMAFVWKFSDAKDIDERFTGYIHQDFYVSGAYGSNIQRAFGHVGTFHPKLAVTRAEAAGTLWQMGQWGDHGHTAAAILREEKTAG